MRRMILSLSAAASTIALTQIASAADLERPIYKAPPPPPLPVYSWTGLYAGVNAGFGWENTINNAATPIFCNPKDPTCPTWAGSAAAAVPQKFGTHPLGACCASCTRIPASERRHAKLTYIKATGGVRLEKELLQAKA
jgi:outer membrane immunogenic protein